MNALFVGILTFIGGYLLSSKLRNEHEKFEQFKKTLLKEKPPKVFSDNPYSDN